MRIPGASRLAEGWSKKILVPALDGEAPAEIVLCRLGGRLYAVDSLCPHAGGRIADGPLHGEGWLLCPLHHYKFDPRDGHSIEIECDPATTYPVREVDGEAEVVLVPQGRPTGRSNTEP